MYRRNIEYRKCLDCHRTFEQSRGTLAMKNPLYGKCPFCGGKSVPDMDMNSARKREIEQKFNELYSNTGHLTKIE